MLSIGYVSLNTLNFNVRSTTRMSSALWKSVLISPVVLGITLLLSTGVIAAPKSFTSNANDLILNKASGATPVKIAAGEPAPATQTQNVPDLGSDLVKPGDWQYSALQSVATKYGCNPNLNNQPVSQLDFARGLNTCLNKVEPLLAQQQPSQQPPAPQPPSPQQSPTVTKEDLEVLKRLTQEFRAQLTEIDSRLT
jgi:hypothetical protein